MQRNNSKVGSCFGLFFNRSVKYVFNGIGHSVPFRKIVDTTNGNFACPIHMKNSYSFPSLCLGALYDIYTELAVIYIPYNANCLQWKTFAA